MTVSEREEINGKGKILTVRLRNKVWEQVCKGVVMKRDREDDMPLGK